jgi:hypothetical protein
LIPSRKVSPIESSFQVANRFLEYIPQLRHDSLAQIPRFFGVFKEYLGISREVVGFSIDQNWATQMISIIESIFDGRQKDSYYKHADFSVFFEALSVIIENTKEISCNSLLQLTPNVFLSASHSRAFIRLVCAVSEKTGFDLMTWIDVVLSLRDVSSDIILHLVSSVLLYSSIPNSARELFRKVSSDGAIPKLRPRELVDHFTQLVEGKGLEVPRFLLKNSPVILDYFLISDMNDVRVACELFFAQLFPDVSTPPKMAAHRISPPIWLSRHERDELVLIVRDVVLPAGTIILDSLESAYPQGYPQIEYYYRYIQVIRIWHFLTTVASRFSDERLDLTIILLQKLARKQCYHDYHLIALLIHIRIPRSLAALPRALLDLFRAAACVEGGTFRRGLHTFLRQPPRGRRRTDPGDLLFKHMQNSPPQVAG